nr:unnamed protein product [Spirometra erinaceieuropaei]
MCPLPSKIEAIRDFPQPTTKRQLQRFFGSFLLSVPTELCWHFLQGWGITVFTNHKPLTFVFRSHSYNPKKIALLLYISPLTNDVRYIVGTKIAMADMLYRPSLFSIRLSHRINLDSMAAVQQRVRCPDDESVSGLQLEDDHLNTGSDSILGAVSTPFHRPFLPVSMRRSAFETLHGLFHPQIRTPCGKVHLAWHEERRPGSV